MGSLEEVAMPQNGINFEGITALSEAFSCNPNLRILNLNDNTFTEKGAKAMAKVMYIGLDKSGYQVNSFLISRRKHMLLVLIGSASVRHF